MMPEETLRSLPDPVQSHFVKLEKYVVGVIAGHIGSLRGMTFSDVHRMNELRRVGANLRQIEGEVARTVGMAERDVHRLFVEASRREYAGRAVYAHVMNRPLPEFEANQNLQALVRQVSGATNGTFSNISNSQAVGMIGKDGQYRALPEFYREAIDRAALHSHLGMDDWNRITRNTVRDMSDGGLRRLVWESGFTQRVDTAVRRSILGGLAELSLQQADMIAEQLEADGMEITWHDGYRPSHDFGGKQVTMLEWRTNYRLRLSEPNCYHRAFAVIMGVSMPTYTDAELASFRAMNEREFKVGGVTYTRYTAEQAQRRFEADIRQALNRSHAFEASGHNKYATQEKVRARQLSLAYRRFSAEAGLPVRWNRVQV